MSDNKQFNRFKQLLSGGATYDECLFYECNDNLIIIGANKQQLFKLPIDIKSIKKLVLIYIQNDNIILKKTLKDFTVADFDDSLIYFDMLEYETNKFKEGKVEAQMKVLLEDNSILVSNVIQINAVESIDKLNFNISSVDINSIQVTVNNQEAKLIQFNTIAAESEETHFCKFIFDSSWDRLLKKAVFKNEYNEYVDNIKIDKNNMCKIPTNIIAQPGNVYVGVVGTISNVTRPTEWSNAFRVTNSCTYKGFVYNNEQESKPTGDIPYADEDTAGILKLYDHGGDNTDGTVTQRAITEGFNSIKFETDGYDDDILVLNVDFEQEI